MSQGRSKRITKSKLASETSQQELDKIYRRELQDIYFFVFFLEDGRCASIAATSNFIKEDLQTRATIEVRIH